jgi:hypothetical protein
MAPLATSLAERVGTIVATAEQAAQRIGADAEAEAERRTESIGKDVRRLFSDQLEALANVRTELAGATKDVEMQFDSLIAAMKRATDALRQQDGQEGRIETAGPLAGGERTSVRLTMSERRDVSVTVSRERSGSAAGPAEAVAGAGRPLGIAAPEPVATKRHVRWWRRLRSRLA